MITTIIEPSRGWRSVGLSALWRHRELAYFLAWRDVRVRYSRATFGALWTVLQPLVATAVFTIVFNRIAQVPSNGLPYPLFVFAALLPWNYFSKATTNSSGSLVSNASLISKVYFPRLLIPLASVMAGALDLVIGMGVLLLLLPFFGIIPGPQIVFVPVLVALAGLTALSVGIWLSALDVQYHDVRYVIPFGMQMWLFATPVLYPASLIPASFQWLYALNPMTSVVEGFRWVFLGGEMLDPGVVVLAFGVVSALLATGVMYFRRVERTFADVI